jgi:hypothetical protein
MTDDFVHHNIVILMLSITIIHTHDHSCNNKYSYEQAYLMANVHSRDHNNDDRQNERQLMGSSSCYNRFISEHQLPIFGYCDT